MDISDVHHRALLSLGDLIDEIDNDQLDSKTPCEQWTLRELIAHIVNGNNCWEPDGPGPFAAVGLPDDVDKTLSEGVATAYRASAKKNTLAWREPGVMERTFETPHGEVSAQDRLIAHTGELVMHGWDVSKTINKPTQFDDEVVQVAADFAFNNFPPQRSEKMPFGAVQTAPEDAALIDKLAAFSGRSL